MEGRSRVTVGLMNGNELFGHMRHFIPQDAELLLLGENPQGGVAPDLRRIPTEEVAYIGLHGNGSRPDRQSEQTSEYKIQTRSGKQFLVQIKTAALDHQLGFYAHPLVEGDLYSEIYFYSKGVATRQNLKPIGMMLVESKAIGRDDLERGLDTQIAQRNIPLGEILIQSKKVQCDDIATALEHQRALQRLGRNLRLGEILVEARLCTNEDIEAALKEQKNRRGKRLGEVLIEMGIVNERDVAEALGRKFGLPCVDLEECQIDPKAILEIPSGLIERYRVLPIRSTERSITIAMSDPLAVEALDMLRFSITKNIIEVIAPPGQIATHLKPFLSALEEGGRERMEDILKNLISVTNNQPQPQSQDVVIAQEDDSAVAKLVNRIIRDAMNRGASDIHVEPNGSDRPIVIRFRVDGICEEYCQLPREHRSQLVARIKIIANLDIAEKRKPQDGKIRLEIDGKRIELRVATIPTVNGNEDVVMRILAKAGALPLDKLGLSTHNHREVVRLFKRPYGLILVVGPTGSGKTTTLHSILGGLNSVERKVWTAEDPVEITQAGLRQVQVNAKIGFTFAQAMRAFLRADPDVIMVGEMRDEETMRIGVEASLTGHLVLSTLHTNSAPETITRLIDMGLDPFSFSDALLGVLAQRLTRRLCPECRRPYKASQAERAEITKHFDEAELRSLERDGQLLLWNAPGCDACSGTGYRGRVAIHELLINNDALRRSIQHRSPASELRDLARQGGMTPLIQDGIAKCVEGQTDLRQVLAICAR